MRKFVVSALIALVLIASPGLRAQPGDASGLDKLEAALAAAPDDLRAGNDYRMAAMKAAQYDRAIAFFTKLTTEHPTAANAWLNFGFAYVDKVPVAGAITQVIMANNALAQFTKSLETKPSWIGYYTRGNSYLYWPRIFNRTNLGIADLQEALKIQKGEKKKAIHERVWISLGDGYWKIDDFEKATATWKEGLAQFPESAALKLRLAKNNEELKLVMDQTYDPNKRVDTSLQDLWAQ